MKTHSIDEEHRRYQLRENKQEILFLRQTLQARRVQAWLEESPEDKLRRLLQEQYWLKRILELEQDCIDYEFVDAAESKEPTWAKPIVIDKHGTHDEDCVCKRCVFKWREEQEAN